MKKIIPIVAGILIIGSSAFYAGAKYSQGKGPRGAREGFGNFANFSSEERQARFRQLESADAAGGAREARVGGGIVAGEILSKDEKSITVKLRDARLPDGQGGSKIIFISGGTQIMKSTEGAAEDLVVGGQVIATGNANSDGSVSAQSIQIRPNLPQR